MKSRQSVAIDMVDVYTIVFIYKFWKVFLGNGSCQINVKYDSVLENDHKISKMCKNVYVARWYSG